MQQYQPLIMLGLIIVIMWFFIEKGQSVVTAGGIYGTVKDVIEEDNALLIEVSKGVCIKVDRNSVYASAQPTVR